MAYIFYHYSLGISGLICLESDNESEGGSNSGNLEESTNLVQSLGRAAFLSRSPGLKNSILDSVFANEHDGLFCRMKDVTCESDLEVVTTTANLDSCDGYAGMNLKRLACYTWWF